jgi:hypothetical protein
MAAPPVSGLRRTILRGLDSINERAGSASGHDDAAAGRASTFKETASQEEKRRRKIEICPSQVTQNYASLEPGSAVWPHGSVD